MVFKLTDAQFVTLQSLFAEVGTSRTTSYADIYDQLVVWSEGQVNVPGSGVEPASIAWLLGAADVNRGEGPFSDFIRSYTSNQHLLRYGTPLEGARLQELSDIIAQGVINQIIINRDNSDVADIPSLAFIRIEDAQTVVDLEFDGDITAWSGVVLFPLLGDRTNLDTLLAETTTTSTYQTLAVLSSLQVAAGSTLTAALTSPASAVKYLFNLVTDYFPPGTAPSVSVIPEVASDLSNFIADAYGDTDFVSNLIADITLGRVGDADDALFISTNLLKQFVHAGAGDDLISVNSALDGDVIDGGDGFDVLNFSSSVGNVTLTSDEGGYAGYRLLLDADILPAETIAVNIETLILGAGDDTIDITHTSNSPLTVLDAGAGDDHITVTLAPGTTAFDVRGGDGNDTFIGGATDDRFDGGDGDDSIIGGDGNDTIDAGDGADFVDGGNGDDFLELSGGLSTVHGGDGDDLISVFGGGFLYGGDGNDTILSFLGGSTVDGGNGDDSIIGGFTSGFIPNSIHGGNGNDTILGGISDDTIFGDAGNDLLLGDFGNDFLYINGADTVDGSDGDDTFIFQDFTLFDAAVGDREGTDTVLFLTGTNQADISLFLEEHDFIEHFGFHNGTLTDPHEAITFVNQHALLDAVFA